jgi:hypothetical protein
VKRWQYFAFGRLDSAVFLSSHSLVDLIANVLAAVFRRVLGRDS